jgi:hypothetical protein
MRGRAAKPAKPTFPDKARVPDRTLPARVQPSKAAPSHSPVGPESRVAGSGGACAGPGAGLKGHLAEPGTSLGVAQLNRAAEMGLRYPHARHLPVSQIRPDGTRCASLAYLAHLPSEESVGMWQAEARSGRHATGAPRRGR